MGRSLGLAAQARPVALGDHVGVYQREGVEITVSERDGVTHLRYAFVNGMAELASPIESVLVAVSESVFAGRAKGAFSEDWMPVVFATLTDGSAWAYIAMRAAPRIA